MARSPGRTGTVERNTAETKVRVELTVDGSGRHDVATGIGFYDHMLAQLARHGGLDLTVRTEGDLHVDAHHTVEDTALALGAALAEALGDKAGVRRFGSVLVPLDEVLVQAAVDLSGRPYVVHEEPAARPVRRWHRPGLPDQPDPALLGVVRPRRPAHPARERAAGGPGRSAARRAPRHRGAVQGGRPGAARRGPRRGPDRRRAQHQGRAVMPAVERDRRAPCIVVLDYGSGNLRSAERALARAGADVTVTSDLAAAEAADGLVVPGVGAYAACMAGIEALGAGPVIADRVAAGRPVLGICVGMQILFEYGRRARRGHQGARACCPAGSSGSTRRGCRTWAGTPSRRRRLVSVRRAAPRTPGSTSCTRTRPAPGDLLDARVDWVTTAVHGGDVRGRGGDRSPRRHPVPPGEVRRRRRGAAAQLAGHGAVVGLVVGAGRVD